ncbi:MAG: hypothetical protein QM742_03075 [Aquabacterium sp.]
MKNISRAGSLALILLCGGLTAQGTAQAAATSQLSFSDVTITLKDLDLGDGIAPSITWDPGHLRQYVDGSESSVIRGENPPWLQFDGQTVSQDFQGPLDASHVTSVYGYQASSGPEGFTVRADVPAAGAWNFLQFYRAGFKLSPQTSVTITVQAKASWAIEMPEGSVIDLGNGQFDNGYGSQWSMSTLQDGGLFITQDEREYIAQPLDCMSCLDDAPYLSGFGTYTSRSKSEQKQLSVTLQNYSDAPSQQYFYALIQQSGYAVAPKSLVPEAGSAAYMGLGVVGLAALLGRRRAAASA